MRGQMVADRGREFGVGAIWRACRPHLVKNMLV
jgi:hypothetical protein